MKQYKWTFTAFITGILLYAASLIFPIDLFERMVEFFEELEHLELDEIFIFTILIIIGLTIDLLFIKKQKEQQQVIQEQQLQVFQMTMTKVHDILNNLLCNLEYFRSELEEQKLLTAEERDTFEEIIDKAATDIKKISQLDNILEEKQET